jgi:coenzyme PQQ precursor peptide PqqA
MICNACTMKDCCEPNRRWWLRERPRSTTISSSRSSGGHKKLEEIMAWTTPTLVEICIGLEINGYLPAEF